MTKMNATPAAGSSAPACSEFRIEYPRDERYEYIEQRHMLTYPSETAGWEQIVLHDGMVGQPCFYVWRRLRTPTLPACVTAAERRARMLAACEEAEEAR